MTNVKIYHGLDLQGNSIINAAGVAEIKRVYGIATNAGGTDQQGLFGGRTI